MTFICMLVGAVLGLAVGDIPGFVAGAVLGGNPIIVRIGIVVLFFGVAFLLKYAADQRLLPIELRLTGVAVPLAGLLALWMLGACLWDADGRRRSAVARHTILNEAAAGPGGGFPCAGKRTAGRQRSQNRVPRGLPAYPWIQPASC